MLRGYNWQVKGYNRTRVCACTSLAQPCRPRGSTRTFQQLVNQEVGASRVQRHGATMHPRGRHLREGRILWSHGTSTALAHEQQPAQPRHDQTQRRKVVRQLHAGGKAYKGYKIERWKVKTQRRTTHDGENEETAKQEPWHQSHEGAQLKCCKSIGVQYRQCDKRQDITARDKLRARLVQNDSKQTRGESHRYLHQVIMNGNELNALNRKQADECASVARAILRGFLVFLDHVQVASMYWV